MTDWSIYEGSDGSYVTDLQLATPLDSSWTELFRDDSAELVFIIRTEANDAQIVVQYTRINETDLPPGVRVQPTQIGPVIDGGSDGWITRCDTDQGTDSTDQIRTLREQAGLNPDLVELAGVGALLGTRSCEHQTLGLQLLRDVTPERADDCIGFLTTLIYRFNLQPDEEVRRLSFACLADLVEHQPDHAKHVGVRLLSLDTSPGAISSVGVAREAARLLRNTAAVVPNSFREPEIREAVLPWLEVEDDETREQIAATLRLVATYDAERVHPAITPLLDRVATGSDRFQRNALRTLGAVAETDSDVARRVVPVALPQPRIENDVLRRTAMNVIASIAAAHPERVSDYTGRVVPQLDEEDVSVRASTSEALAAVAPSAPVTLWEAMPRFVELLDDEYPPIRRNACRALGHIGATEARATLRELHETDPDHSVRYAAGTALDRL